MMKKILQMACMLPILANAQVNLVSNLKVCLPFNGNAMDISGNGNNGTVSGAALTTDRFGNPNQAYLFNGTSDYIALNSFAALAPTNELTVSMWAKASSTTSNCLFEIITDSPSDRCVGCAQYSNGGSTMMLWDYGNLSGGGRTTATGIPIDNASWHHYVYTLSQSGNLKQMYLDGSAVSNSAYGLSCMNKNKPFYIGSATDSIGGDLRFHGSIDDVCIYNRALNSSEVSALYSGTNACFTTGINELQNFDRVMVYPTVSQTGVYKISKGNRTNIRIEIYSVDGRLIRSYTDDEEQVNIGDAGNGVYILKIMDNKVAYTQKIVKY